MYLTKTNVTIKKIENQTIKKNDCLHYLFEQDGKYENIGLY